MTTRALIIGSIVALVAGIAGVVAFDAVRHRSVERHREQIAERRRELEPLRDIAAEVAAYEQLKEASESREVAIDEASDGRSRWTPELFVVGLIDGFGGVTVDSALISTNIAMVVQAESQKDLDRTATMTSNYDVSDPELSDEEPQLLRPSIKRQHLDACGASCVQERWVIRLRTPPKTEP